MQSVYAYPNPSSYGGHFQDPQVLERLSRKGLLYQRCGHHRVEMYIDADWAGSLIDRRSTLGYCTFIGGNLITWSKKPVMARSTTKVEFISMAYGVRNVS